MATLRWPQLLAELRALIKSFQSTTSEGLHLAVRQHKQTFLNLLRDYKAQPADFSQYLHFDDSGYTKILLEEFGPKSNVIIMCWAPGQASAFHAHEGSRCFVKVLAGQLVEQQVSYPTAAQHQQLASSQNKQVTTRLIKLNQVTYIDDSIGVHQVSNPSAFEPAVTLHVYLPAYTRCRVFEGSQGDSLLLERSFAIDVEFKSKQTICK